MKIYKISSLTTFLFIFLIIGLAVFLPITLIQALWNSTIGKAYIDINIDFWQALILWLIFLVFLNVLGLFKFEFAIEAGDSFDKELLKKKIEEVKELQNLTQQPGEKAENKSIDKEEKK